MRDKNALCLGLQDGTIDAICSDHTPVDDDAKLLPFTEAEAGATGLELLLPLALKWGQNQGVSLSKVITSIALQPAQILGLQAGHLSLNADADIAIFDPNLAWKVSASALKSQGKNTPFLGLELQGRVQITMLHGQIVHQNS
jgi:dihydroorotase